MIFNEYIKTCRTNNDMTQEELVNDLYIFDIEHFSGLDTTTLSKWERGVTKPRIAKQVGILRYFQRLTNNPFPCFDKLSIDEIERDICITGMQSIIADSKSKKLILDLPSSTMSIGDLEVYQLKESNMLDKVVKINTYLDANFNNNATQLKAQDFKKWALQSGGLFLACEFAGEVLGLLFTLKLKQDAFDRIMNGKIMEKDLAEDDFASPSEVGSSYILSFFALNKKAASMLFVRYYAYLVAHQKEIEEIGVATMMKDAQKLIENINLPYYNSCMIGNKLELQFFKASLFSFLATENVVKMILSTQDCEEE